MLILTRRSGETIAIGNDITVTVLGINGRKMYQTWYQMTALLKAGMLDLHPVITDRLAMSDFGKGMEMLNAGTASKILLYPNGVK